MNQVIPCQLGAHTETLLPRQDVFHAHSADKSLSSRRGFPSRAQALAPAVYLRPGLIPGCLLPSAVNRIGPLTGQEKTLFGLPGPDGQTPAICFTLQIRLGEIKAAAGEAEEIRRRLEGDIIFTETTRAGIMSPSSGAPPGMNSSASSGRLGVDVWFTLWLERSLQVIEFFSSKAP